jgi:hypothetical protein
MLSKNFVYQTGDVEWVNSETDSIANGNLSFVNFADDLLPYSDLGASSSKYRRQQEYELFTYGDYNCFN